ncbi:hypothetical protein ACRQ4B_15685 [Curtobacterium sp. SP.BCo]|uniref:hypothetical protein n=1 Tax=Curtobacterium sp. SP.BCo TaxID=3435229 RepID=UPI003F73DAE1
MRAERTDEQTTAEHDPYRRRPGWVAGPDGRTDRTTMAAVAGVVAGFVSVLVLGFVQVREPVAFPVAVVVGVVVWLVVRARWRRRERQAGRSPDAVPHARDRAIAEANGGRRFFVAPNPVVLIVMGGIFIAVAVVPVTIEGPSVVRLVISILIVASGVTCIVQGIGTLVVRRRGTARRDRGRATDSSRSSGTP